MKLADSPGSICIPTMEMQRFLLFTISLAGTNQPPNCYLNATASGSVTENLNNCFRQLRTEGEPLPGSDQPAVVTDRWAWVMGDDHCWRNETLVDMLLIMDEHPEIDVLVPLVTKRNPPWHLVLFHDQHGKDEMGNPLFDVMGWDEIPPPGSDPFPVDAAGSAGMLIRREVIDHFSDPWFYNTVDNEGRGVVLNEDVTWCQRIRDEGFSLYATSDVVLGHLGIFNVRPLHNGERWGALTEFATMEDRFRHVFMPVEEPVHA